jgi:hypothetical protein
LNEKIERTEKKSLKTFVTLKKINAGSADPRAAELKVKKLRRQF